MVRSIYPFDRAAAGGWKILADSCNLVYWDQEDRPNTIESDGTADGNALEEDNEAVR